jgi:hypothetical protein
MPRERPSITAPMTARCMTGPLFTDNGFWDTWRAVFPCFALVYPDLDSQIMQGLANTYKEGGWLPEWASPGHRDVMIGSNSANLIADAYLNGVRGFDVETLYEAMVKNATTSRGPPDRQEGQRSPRSAARASSCTTSSAMSPMTSASTRMPRARSNMPPPTSRCRASPRRSARPKTRRNTPRSAELPQALRCGIGLDARPQQGRQLDEAVQPLCVGRRLHRGQFDALQLVGDAGRAGPDRSDGRRPKFVERLDSIFTCRRCSTNSYYGSVIHETARCRW